jgi:hypothetical protein
MKWPKQDQLDLNKVGLDRYVQVMLNQFAFSVLYHMLCVLQIINEEFDVCSVFWKLEWNHDDVAIIILFFLYSINSRLKNN